MPHYFVKKSFIADEYCKDMMTDPNSFEIESEELDPRVQEELEKLNNCTDEINRLEYLFCHLYLIFYYLPDLRSSWMTPTLCSDSSCQTPPTTSRVCPRDSATA